jgi:type II secretory pathway pseudopilin PulG
MTARDRVVLLVLLVGGLLAGFWFVAVTPKREEARRLSEQISAERTRLEDAQRSEADARAAKARYRSDYATIARLGKAVPLDDDVPSLVYQVENAAIGSRVDFRTFKTTSSGSSAATTSGIGAIAAAGTAVKTNGAGTPSAPATQAASAALPPGATVGSAGFPTMPFAFTFEGSFFDMQRFFERVQEMVALRGTRLDVNGRLLSIDGFALAAGRKGFPQVKASLTATTYLLPPDQGLTGGATPQGPASGATASAGSGSTTTATVTGVK